MCALLSWDEPAARDRRGSAPAWTAPPRVRGACASSSALTVGLAVRRSCAPEARCCLYWHELFRPRRRPGRRRVVPTVGRPTLGGAQADWTRRFYDVGSA